MVLKLIVMTFAFSASVAHSESFTNKDATRISVSSGLAQAGAAYVIKSLPQLSSQVAVTNPIIYQGLSDINISSIVKMVDDTWMAREGWGTVGGAEVSVIYDAGQAARILGAKNGKQILGILADKTDSTLINEGVSGVAATGVALEAAENAKPALQTETLYPRLIGNKAQLEEKLRAIQSSQAGIVEVRVRGVLPRYVGGSATGVFQLIFVTGSVANLIRAWDFATSSGAASTANWTNKCKGEDVSQCEVGWMSPTWLYNTSDAVFYKFYADK